MTPGGSRARSDATYKHCTLVYLAAVYHYSYCIYDEMNFTLAFAVSLAAVEK